MPLHRHVLAEAAQASLPPNRLLEGMPPAEHARLTPLLDVVALRPGTALCEAGTPLRFVWFPHDAVASTIVDLPEGNAIDVGLLGHEAFAGIDAVYGGVRSVTTVVVLAAGHASRMHADDFRREVVARNGEAYAVCLRFAAAYQREMAHMAACNARHNVVQRLARLLLMIDDRRSGGVIEVTHDRLAVMLATRRASVTDAAHVLRAAGALEYRRGDIAIRDRAALLAAACGCYAVLSRLAARAEAR